MMIALGNRKYFGLHFWRICAGPYAKSGQFFGKTTVPQRIAQDRLAKAVSPDLS
jgi:hypothetical protein